MTKPSDIMSLTPIIYGVFTSLHKVIKYKMHIHTFQILVNDNNVVETNM